MRDRLGDRLNHFLVGKLNPLVRRAVALRYLERDRAFIKTGRRSKADRESLESRTEPLRRGEQVPIERIDSAHQETGDRDIGEKMFLDAVSRRRGFSAGRKPEES
jgi:hypothetical protein